MDGDLSFLPLSRSRACVPSCAVHLPTSSDSILLVWSWANFPLPTLWSVSLSLEAQNCHTHCTDVIFIMWWQPKVILIGAEEFLYWMENTHPEIFANTSIFVFFIALWFIFWGHSFDSRGEPMLVLCLMYLAFSVLIDLLQVISRGDFNPSTKSGSLTYRPSVSNPFRQRMSFY